MNMNISKKINAFRMTLMRTITKNIGNSNSDKNSNLSIKSVLICRPNGRLGNILLITPLVQEVLAVFPECKIDLLVKGGLAPIVFQNYENVNHFIQLPSKPFKNLIKYAQAWNSIRKYHYDIVINVDENSSSGRLSTQFSDSKYKLFGDINEIIKLKYKDHQHMAKYPIYSFRNYLTKLGIPENSRPLPSLNLKLSTSEIAKGKEVLKELIHNEKKTICIFTYATGDKCYSEFWWEKFYERLVNEYTDYNIIEVLPVENISKIGFKATSFYSKNIREIGSVIANADLFIGADSGIMHLASAVKTSTVGLFSVTDAEKYQPYQNNSVAIKTNESRIDEWIQVINEILNKNIKMGTHISFSA